MNSRFPNLNSLWAEAAVEELVRCGVRLFCLCPGSRSTPLTAAAARHEAARKIVHFDERGAAFCALGYARATEKPAAVVVTSGTAAANLYPAVIEAAMDGVPLLVLTADRPPELRASGANQTIDQTKLYADYPRWFFDLPCPSRETPPEFVLTTIDQAVYRAQHGPAGPVHLNWMFREPLAPVGAEEDFGDYLRSVGCWRTGESPWTIYRSPVKVCEPARMEAATGLLNRARRGVIVVGRLRREAERVAIAKVAEALGWPVIADIGSGLRLGAAGHVIAPAEYMLAAESFADALAPDTVLHFGPIVTSKRVAQWLKRSQPAAYIHAAAAPERHDPHHQVTHRFEADIDMFCSFLLPFLREKAKETGLAAWRAGADKAEAAIARVLAEDATLSEPLTARLVAENISAAGALFVASSMPIRDLDALAAGDGPAAP
ncbi:MAG TPA: 2-succinyl-5-enolpyruvyl-6-hydroxy-3-cyclohexene-1-carboxylic-acid synthase, partial [candidate division Zixibacteria bacterium]|nr:2-succinyl-5-enolpyruvyl-6-hydroxy-3-cyclohexene-1-carboxylic-acid synthase [candidate division Zixibacteria bacterium]